MQLLYRHSQEGNVDCLGVLEGSVRRLAPAGKLPIPHMGWNRVRTQGTSRLLEGIRDGSHFYFVHSFRAPDGAEVKAVAEYGERVPAVIESGNWFGTQFHPERSGRAGELVLRNFIEMEA
jgi:glutamine amidotransferase